VQVLVWVALGGVDAVEMGEGGEVLLEVSAAEVQVQVQLVWKGALDAVVALAGGGLEREIRQDAEYQVLQA